MNIKGWVPWIAAFDIHGDQQDAHAVQAFHRFCKVWKPKLRILGGDLWDFRPLRRKASSDERQESMRADFHKGMNFLGEFRPTHYLRGNHCERLWHMAESNNGPESDYAQQGVEEVEKFVERIGCRMYPYNVHEGYYTQGDLTFIHGFGGGEAAAKRSASRWHNVIQGHLHTITDLIATTNRVRVAGCLCSRRMKYAETQIATLNWQHGWVYGVYNAKTGKNLVWQAVQIDGEFFLPEKVATF